MGGGEKHAGAIAAVLAEHHTVEFISHEPVDVPRLATYLGLDLRRVGLRLVPDRPDFAGVIAASVDYDLFVNASHFDYFAPRARRNALIVYFPATSVEAATALGAYNRVKRAVRLGVGPLLGERLRGTLRAVMFGQTGRSSEQTFLGRAALAGFRLATQPKQQANVLDAYESILAISEFTRHWIRTYWDRDSTVLHPEIAVDELQPLPKMPWVLSVGRFFAGSHNKKQVELIRAFRQSVKGPLAGWELHQAWIAGIALSTTSVAVVYAVMIETGLNQTELGKMILAACFVTDFGTVLALGVLFANFNGFLVLFVVVLAVSLYFMPRWTRFVIKNVGNRVSEPEIKFIFFMLFLLGGFATAAKSEAVLPAYLVGLVIAGVFVRDKVLVNRMRSIAFALLTPFYFLKAGLFVSLPAVAAGAGLIVALLLVKMACKALVVWPSAKAFHLTTRESNYTTLLMSTGLTFGTISALFGLTNGIISQTQYTILVTVVIGSAVVPTLIAQTFFRPEIPVRSDEETAEALEEPVPTRSFQGSPAPVDSGGQ